MLIHFDSEVAAAAAANSDNPATIAPPSTTVTPPPAPTQIPVKEENKTASSWSDAMGFWAWKKKSQQDAVPAALAAPAVAQEAPVTTVQTKRP